MPPVVSIPLACLFYAFFQLILGLALKIPLWIYPMFSGFVVGYLFYDMTHYGMHHFKVRRGPFYQLKQYHMLHHFKTPEKRFGVSSPFWDIIFRTRPAA
jgi:sterol desaturase/sphingolipid hydroxylase (fatty acid hydroxylase superfamily)